VIYPGIRAAYDLPRVTQELTRLLGQRFRLTDLSSGFIAALGMAPEDATILSLRKEWKTLDDLDAITARPFEVRSIVLALYYCDLLEREPLNQPAADSAVPRSVHMAQSSDVGPTFKLPGDSGANLSSASDSGAAAAPPRSDAAHLAGMGTGSATRPSGIFHAAAAASSPYEAIAVGGGSAAGGRPAVTQPAPSVPVVQAPFVGVVRGDAKSPPAPVGKAAVPPRFVSSQTPEVLRATILDMAQKIGRVTHFELLGLGQSASSDEVGIAFVRAARQFHPDRLSSAGLLDLQPTAERILARINEAAMILGDASRRAEYVASLVVGAPTVRASLPTVLEAENAFLKGEVFLKKGEHAKAIEAFMAASQGNPSEPQYHAYLAWARYDDPRARKEVLVRETLKTLEGILRERPKFARGFYWVGLLWKFLNEPGKAERAFREAVTLDDSFIEASRELRLIDMRKSKSPTKPEPPGGGFMGKLFKK
jgi:hypothetical protein